MGAVSLGMRRLHPDRFLHQRLAEEDNRYPGYDQFGLSPGRFRARPQAVGSGRLFAFKALLRQSN
jgi:hypothetical protein